MKKIKDFYKNLTFTQGAVFAITLSSVITIAAPITGINLFSSGETISSSAVNQNFNILKLAVEGIPSGQIYMGTHNASTGAPSASSAPGEYYIITTAGSFGGDNYALNDWTMWNGSVWERVPSSSTITSVFSRTGVITATEGDYSLNLLSDVDTLSPTPADGNLLRFDGTQWRATQLPTCVGMNVLNFDGSAFTCVPGNAGAPAFMGPANRVVITNGTTGALTTSNITITELDNLAGVSSSIQTQINSKQPTLLTGSVTSTHILDGTILDADLAGGIAQSKIFDLTSALANKQNTSSLATSVLSTSLTGLTLASNIVISAADTVLAAIGKLQKQISEMGTTKLSLTGGTMSIGTIGGVPNPITADQVANKAYVDSMIVAAPVSCPMGYIYVPADVSFYSKGFCVGKYEAKNDGYGRALSTASGLPWVNINRDTSRSHCLALGFGHDLISNDQWQTIARNIADVASNWSSGVVASGEINRGHSDNTPSNAIPVSFDDNDACDGTGQTCSSIVWHSQRRTHKLSNGATIWDFAGNVSEWVTDNNIGSNGADGYISTYTGGGDIRQTRYGAAAHTICPSPATSPYCGMGRGMFNIGGGGIMRGDSFYGGESAGIYGTNLTYGPIFTSANTGFRCVFVP